MAKPSAYACRVCGCTEEQACMPFGCSWVKAEAGSPPLCSSCSGSPGDMLEALKRGERFLTKLTKLDVAMAVRVGRAAVRRRNARIKAEAKI
mgnify:CR=1 FL=1